MVLILTPYNCLITTESLCLPAAAALLSEHVNFQLGECVTRLAYSTMCNIICNVPNSANILHCWNIISNKGYWSEKAIEKRNLVQLTHRCIHQSMRFDSLFSKWMHKGIPAVPFLQFHWCSPEGMGGGLFISRKGLRNGVGARLQASASPLCRSRSIISWVHVVP